LWKAPRIYFAIQNSNEYMKGFLRSLWTIWARTHKKVRQPWARGTESRVKLSHLAGPSSVEPYCVMQAREFSTQGKQTACYLIQTATWAKWELSFCLVNCSA
jgi:hypothetical protein